MTKSPHLRGEVKILPLSSVQPNGWNPNKMTPEMKESLKHGLVQDGWLLSQALLVWNSDEDGEEHHLIIDGEHRWAAAVELGMPNGPMVLLDGISKADAKALTVKLNQKRGDWDESALSTLLQDLSASARDGLSGLDLGFGDEALMKLMALAPFELPAPEAPPPIAAGAPAPAEGGTQAAAPAATETSSVRMVQLFLDDKTQPEFIELVRKLGEQWGTKNVTDTVLEAVRRHGG